MKSLVALLGSLTLLVPGAALWAATVEYDLTIARREMNFTGHPVKAMTINGQLPGPTLRFTEGDHAVIRVHNRMDVESSIHWHGILLPNAMDGVPFLTYPPIAPGETFTYEFDLRQSGTTGITATPCSRNSGDCLERWSSRPGPPTILTGSAITSWCCPTGRTRTRVRCSTP